jgi:hypothetical protein
MTAILDEMKRLSLLCSSLRSVDLFDSGTKSGEGILVRTVTGRYHLFVIGGFSAGMRWRNATEITPQGERRQVRFFAGDHLVQANQSIRYCSDPDDENQRNWFTVDALFRVGIIILNDQRETEGGE